MENEGPKSTKGLVMPLEVTSQGSLKGLYIGEDGVAIKQYNVIPEGCPIVGDVSILTASSGSPLLREETIHTGRSGPAKVNSDAYREGWDRIFGKKMDAEA